MTRKLNALPRPPFRRGSFFVFKRDNLGSDAGSWFVTRVAGKPAGLVRVLHELPLDLYAEYGYFGDVVDATPNPHPA